MLEALMILVPAAAAASLLHPLGRRFVHRVAGAARELVDRREPVALERALALIWRQIRADVDTSLSEGCLHPTGVSIETDPDTARMLLRGRDLLEQWLLGKLHGCGAQLATVELRIAGREGLRAGTLRATSLFPEEATAVEAGAVPHRGLHGRGPMAARLVDTGHGEEHTVRDATTLGRHPENDLVLPAKTVSRHQARFGVRSGIWRVLCDERASRSILVQGRRLAPGESCPLPAGAAVEIGGAWFRFEPNQPANLARES